MKDKKSRVLRPNPWKIVRIFVILLIVFEIIFYVSFQGAMSGKFWPLESSFYVYTISLVAASILFCSISITQTSYEITSLKLIHTKMGKVFEYFWSDIIYIDEEFTNKKKMLLFYTKDGRDHFLTLDKEGKIYEAALKKCHLMDKEEFRKKFPNKKI